MYVPETTKRLFFWKLVRLVRIGGTSYTTRLKINKANVYLECILIKCKKYKDNTIGNKLKVRLLQGLSFEEEGLEFFLGKCSLYKYPANICSMLVV